MVHVLLNVLLSHGCQLAVGCAYTYRIRHGIYCLHGECQLEYNWIAAQRVNERRCGRLATLPEGPETADFVVKADKPVVRDQCCKEL